MIKIFFFTILLNLPGFFNGYRLKRNIDHKYSKTLFVYDTVQLIDNYLLKLTAEKNFSGGLLIVKDGKKFFCKGYGLSNREKNIPFSPHTLASIGSITKLFTATAILWLADHHLINLNDRLKKFFPAVPSDKATITIQQLLTHSAGFHEFLKQNGGDYEKINKTGFLKRAFAEPLAFKPGEKAVYTNVGYSILGIILEQVAKQDYETFLKTKLFAPLKIRSISYHYPVSANDTIAIGYQNGKPWGTHPQHFEEAGGGPFWNLKANGGLEVSLNEMFLWINGFTDYTVLQKQTIEKMFSPQVAETGYHGGSFFGYGCNIQKSWRNTTMIESGGSNGIYFARLVRLPEEGMVFYMVTNESTINTNMVLPNITQLYFQGKITQDALTQKPNFENLQSESVYKTVLNSDSDLGKELSAKKIVVEDDMVLLEVGQKLLAENNTAKALILYQYYTKTFPGIVVAWNDLGDIYLQMNNKEAAMDCYNKALKIRPGNLRAKERLEKLKKNK
jgi:CubicO group peptidase (beta-lactamase class C family)